MFEISNEISYDGKMVLADDQKNNLGKCGWFDIQGKANNKYVKEQGDFLKKKIEIMAKEKPAILDKKKEDIIYVITPFRNVAYQLAKTLNPIGFTRYDKKGKPTNIGTIHTFQGKEAPIVFLVLGADKQSSGAARWAVSEPNMMNVAATRAKKEFYIIGDKELYLGFESKVVNSTWKVIKRYGNEHPELIDNEIDFGNRQQKDENDGILILEKKDNRDSVNNNAPERPIISGTITYVGVGKKSGSKFAYIKGDDGDEYRLSEWDYPKIEHANDIIIKGNRIKFVIKAKGKDKYIDHLIF